MSALARCECVALGRRRVKPARDRRVVCRQDGVAAGLRTASSGLRARCGTLAGIRSPVAHGGAIRPVHVVTPSSPDGRTRGRSVEAGGTSAGATSRSRRANHSVDTEIPRLLRASAQGNRPSVAPVCISRTLWGIHCVVSTFETRATTSRDFPFARLLATPVRGTAGLRRAAYRRSTGASRRNTCSTQQSRGQPRPSRRRSQNSASANPSRRYCACAGSSSRLKFRLA